MAGDPALGAPWELCKELLTTKDFQNIYLEAGVAEGKGEEERKRKSSIYRFTVRMAAMAELGASGRPTCLQGCPPLPAQVQ